MYLVCIYSVSGKPKTSIDVSLKVHQNIRPIDIVTGSRNAFFFQLIDDIKK